MNIPCDTVRDLLPLYHDEVCSQESRKLVEEHLAGCESCRAELAKMGKEEPSAMETARPLKEIAETWKKSKLDAFFKGALLISLVAMLACGVAYNVIGSYVAPDGTLVEPFALIPLAWLFAFLALIFGACLLISRLCRRHKRRK